MKYAIIEVFEGWIHGNGHTYNYVVRPSSEVSQFIKNVQSTDEIERSACLFADGFSTELDALNNIPMN